MIWTFPFWEPQLCGPGLCSTTQWCSIPMPCTARVLLRSWGGRVASLEGWLLEGGYVMFPQVHRLLPWGILREAIEKGRSRNSTAGLASPYNCKAGIGASSEAACLRRSLQAGRVRSGNGRLPGRNTSGEETQQTHHTALSSPPAPQSHCKPQLPFPSSSTWSRLLWRP